MEALRTAATVCLLAGMLPLARAIQVTVVCADLVGAGGVGIRVWPTLKASPERRSKIMQFRLLQVNWEVERLLEGDWVGVFEEDPRPPHMRPPPTSLPPTSNRDWRTPQPLFWDTPFATQGTITTNYTQPRVELSVLARGGCVGPYVGFVRNGVCVAADCLASHPTWLYDHRAVLGSRSLRSLVLPGSHNAGSYSLADDNDVVAAWVVCQDEDIISQLLYGIRYLDLRVGYYPDTHELLWVNHDLVRWRPLQDVLDGVRGFLALSPDPVIIDIHRTPVGFKLPEAMELLLSLMNATLGGHFVHSRYGPHITLDDLWQMGKRVLFTFNDPTVSDYTPWVWPPLPQAWANAQLLDDLRTFLDSQMNKRFESPRLWAAMAHLTPTFWDLLFRSHVGVRGLADRVSFPITRWLRERWGHMANIVASDFFRGNDIVNVAFRTNLALSMCRPSDPSRHPYTLRWTAELTLRQGSPSTTIPPFVRRMYSGGALWSTTGVRHIHYPFIPVDANISMVFTAIPTRIPSVAPGVTYEDNGDTWREVFHYPTDGSPQQPRAAPPRPTVYLPNSSPSFLRAPTESSLTASVEAIMAEWDDVDGHDFIDAALSGGLTDDSRANTNDSAGIRSSSSGETQDLRPLHDEGPAPSGYRVREGDTFEPPTHQGSGVQRLIVPPPLSRDLENRELHDDMSNNSDSLSPTSNVTVRNDSLAPISVDAEEVEYLFFTSNIHQDNDSSLLVSDYKQDYNLLPATTAAALNASSSPTVTVTQDSDHFPFIDNTIYESSSSLLINNNTQADSYLTTIHDINDTSHLPPVRDSFPVVSPTTRVSQNQDQVGVWSPAPSGDFQGLWQPDTAVPGTESNSGPTSIDFLTLLSQQTQEHSAERPELAKYPTDQPSTSTSTIVVEPTAPTVTVNPNPPSVATKTNTPTVRVQLNTPTVTLQPETPTARVQLGVGKASAQPVVPTAQLGVSDLTGANLSSQVT